MRIAEVVTFLEMRSPDDLVPGAPAPVDLVLGPPDQRFRDTQVRVGGPHHWPTTDWSHDQWEGWLAGPGLHHGTFVDAGEAVGMLTVQEERHAAEIVAFGLVPEATGRGLGGHALTLAVLAAWAVHPDVRRVWLHTSSLDHPHALANYRRRGFEVFGVEHRTREI
jgi:RimJ/RimL family protein N-acetyltransferase